MRGMPTSTISPKGRLLLNLARLALIIGGYFLSCAVLINLDHRPALIPFLGGIVVMGVTALAARRLVSWSALICGLVLIVFLPEPVAGDFLAGGCAVVALVGSIFIACLLFGGRGETVEQLPGEPESKPRRIIGLSGYAGSGKDTAALGLLEQGWARVAVSDAVLKLALAIDPMIPFYSHVTSRTLYMRLSEFVADVGYTKAKDNPEVRRFLQALGVAVRDQIDPDAWVKATMANLPDGNLVFTSVRFPNEAQAIKDAGGHIVRVQRPLVQAQSMDPTEVSMDDWPFDAYLNNDMGAAEAGHRLRGIVERLYGDDGSTVTLATFDPRVHRPSDSLA